MHNNTLLGKFPNMYQLYNDFKKCAIFIQWNTNTKSTATHNKSMKFYKQHTEQRNQDTNGSIYTVYVHDRKLKKNKQN